jgi:hypothetical protein
MVILSNKVVKKTIFIVEMRRNVPDRNTNRGATCYQMKSTSGYETVYVSFQGRNNKKSITEVTVTEDVHFWTLSLWGKCLELH